MEILKIYKQEPQKCEVRCKCGKVYTTSYKNAKQSKSWLCKQCWYTRNKDDVNALVNIAKSANISYSQARYRKEKGLPMNHKRIVKTYLYQGDQKTISEIAKLEGVTRQAIDYRYKNK